MSAPFCSTCGRVPPAHSTWCPHRSVRITCFYCDGGMDEADAKLTSFGRVYGPCCEDLVRVCEQVFEARL